MARAELPLALQALRAWQAGLASVHPALRCGLYLRSDGAQTEATVMESYAVETVVAAEGIDEALRRAIEDSGHAVLQPWLRESRHVEVFDAWSG